MNALHHQGDNGSVIYCEITGLDLLSKDSNIDVDASNSSYSSYCNDSLHLIEVRRKIVEPPQQRRRASTSGIVNKLSISTIKKLQRASSVKEMINFQSGFTNQFEDELPMNASAYLHMTTHALSKEVGGQGKISRSFSCDLLASQAVAGGAGRAA